MKLAQNPSLLSELLSTPLKIQEISPLVLPRFKLDCELDIKQQLISLGVSTAFSESAADLSGVVYNFIPIKQCIRKSIHFYFTYSYSTVHSKFTLYLQFIHTGSILLNFVRLSITVPK